MEIPHDGIWSMAAVHFEDWITRKRSLRPSLWESAYVGYQAVTSVTARTALGRKATFRRSSFPLVTVMSAAGKPKKLCRPVRSVSTDD